MAAGTATGALMLVGQGLAGCSAKDAASEETPPKTSAEDIFALEPVGEPSKTIKTDVVIIGAGGSGLATAIQAGQLGLKTVILEKMGATGGSYICTEGLYMINAHYQTEIGVHFDVDKQIAALLDYHHWNAVPAMFKKFFGMNPEMIEWCDEIGIEFDRIISMGSTPQSVLVWAHDPKSSLPGTLAGKALTSAAEKVGADIRLQVPVKKILVEDGKAVGVIAQERDGSYLKVEAPAVVIATGGYGKNAKMLDKLANFAGTPFDAGMPGRDGDGIKLGLDAGVRLWDYPGTLLVSGPVVIGTEWPARPVLLSLSPLLWINQNCERFIREDLTNVNFTFSGDASKQQKRILSLFTQKDLDHFENIGLYSRIFSLIEEGQPLKGITDDLKALKEKHGSVYVGDTIEDLAKVAKLDAGKLNECISRYNQMCAAGADTDFGKLPHYLHGLEEGPYYAMECAVVFYGNCGALRVTPDCECVDTEYATIPGLYAVGQEAGGLYSDSYDANLAGCTAASWALTSGRIVGMHIAEKLKG
ncbi:MAG: FAD-dependent oxidoreductase [Coriobacteriia bacterium]